MDIKKIRLKFAANLYRISQHAEEERETDQITFSELEGAVAKSEIIEECPDDPRGESCLILGFTSKNKPIHIVCADLSEEKILIVTVYRPDPEKWIEFRKRKGDPKDV